MWLSVPRAPLRLILSSQESLAPCTSTAVAAVVRGNEEFSRRLYREVVKDSENLVVSPFSVSMVMAMVAEGAQGDTLDQILQGLALGGLDSGLGYRYCQLCFLNM